MSDPISRSLATWLTEPLAPGVAESIERLRCSDDVQQVAVMPDVHLSHDVCIGVVVATHHLVYPRAVGSDIGCGMAAVAFDAAADVIDNQRAAARVFQQLYEQVPSLKHRQRRSFPEGLRSEELSSPALVKVASREGSVQLGTLGRGNHFLELQRDDQGRLWAMVHSGSRGIGQAISEHHLQLSTPTCSGLVAFDAREASGRAYLGDTGWATRYAAHNRLAMLQALSELLVGLFGIATDWDTLVHSDHNHVRREQHAGDWLWVHRKGAQSAREGEGGIIPGSMGAPSFHITGRGCHQALHSCSHGAGRQLSRTVALQQVTARDFERQVKGVWFDHRRTSQLRDEAPAAYKDIRQVMRAQRELVRIERELRPVLTYKGC